MSVKGLSTLEQHLANNLLHGFSGPLRMLSFDLCLAKTTGEQLSVTKKLIEKYLSTDGQPAVVDLQDGRISALFDEAMVNMARDTVQKALKQTQQMKRMERLVDSMSRLHALMDSLKPKTWKDYAKQGIQRVGAAVSKTVNRSSILKGGVDAACRGLSQIGVISKKQPPEAEIGIVLIEEGDDWHEVETDHSYAERISSILKNWEKNPSILLEAVKGDIDYLRNDLLPRARSMNLSK